MTDVKGSLRVSFHPSIDFEEEERKSIAGFQRRSERRQRHLSKKQQTKRVRAQRIHAVVGILRGEDGLRKTEALLKKSAMVRGIMDRVLPPEVFAYDLGCAAYRNDLRRSFRNRVRLFFETNGGDADRMNTELKKNINILAKWHDFAKQFPRVLPISAVADSSCSDSHDTLIDRRRKRLQSIIDSLNDTYDTPEDRNAGETV
jgi:hypothetical protein